MPEHVMLPWNPQADEHEMRKCEGLNTCPVPLPHVAQSPMLLVQWLHLLRAKVHT